MVRLTDIIKRKEGEKFKPASSEKPTHEDKVRFAGSQVINMDDVNNFTDLMPKDEETLKLETYYEQLLERAIDIRDKVRESKGIIHSPVLALLHQILDNDLVETLYEYSTLATRDTGLPSHTISVTLASMKVGQGLGYDTKNLLRLGLAAFLENIGMYKIPDAILNKAGKLTSYEIEVISNHPETSAQILRQMGSAFGWLAKVALQTHERTDGSGYPRGLSGSEISEYASIIAIIDTYMAMIENKPHRRKYLQTDAVKNILEESKTKFPPRVMKEFLNQISLFPVNTYVRLNNKSIGRIISTDEKQPLRPTIELLFDGVGHKIAESKIVNLAESPLLHIVNTIDESELPL